MRQGNVRAEVVPGDSYPDLAYRVSGVVSPGTHIMTDKLPTYTEIGKEYAEHECVYHVSKEFCLGDVHVNTAESFNAILERAKLGVFNYLSKSISQSTSEKLSFGGTTGTP